MTIDENTRCELLAFVRKNTLLSERIEPTTDLLEAGVIDSLMVADLFVFIETRFGVVLRSTDVSPQNFRSVDRLVQLILTKKLKPDKAA
jgi:acyl carrier protein